MRQKGFTLVELLVVIAIIGLLSTVAVVAVNNAGVSARNQQRKANLVQISKALELYYADHDGYPNTGGAWSGQGSTFGGHGDADPDGWITGLAPAYMAKLPRDPLSTKPNPNNLISYCRTGGNLTGYIYRSDGVDYKVAADCLPEGSVSTSDPFYEAASGNQHQAFSVYTPGAKSWW
jgi:prepilin-type N-terminal cleavage/methylation domain-containing protein